MKLQANENEGNIRRELQTRISLAETRAGAADAARISAENARRKAETDLFEAKLKYEEELVNLEKKVRNETEVSFINFVCTENHLYSQLMYDHIG